MRFAVLLLVSLGFAACQRPLPQACKDICEFYGACAEDAQHEIDGCPIRLVTGDGDIKDAAVAAGCGDRVMELADYLKEIGFAS